MIIYARLSESRGKTGVGTEATVRVDFQDVHFPITVNPQVNASVVPQHENAEAGERRALHFEPEGNGYPSGEPPASVSVFERRRVPLGAIADNPVQTVRETGKIYLGQRENMRCRVSEKRNIKLSAIDIFLYQEAAMSQKHILDIFAEVRLVGKDRILVNSNACILVSGLHDDREPQIHCLPSRSTLVQEVLRGFDSASFQNALCHDLVGCQRKRQGWRAREGNTEQLEHRRRVRHKSGVLIDGLAQVEHDLDIFLCQPLNGIPNVFCERNASRRMA